jgi:hypothetical protein
MVYRLGKTLHSGNADRLKKNAVNDQNLRAGRERVGKATLSLSKYGILEMFSHVSDNTSRHKQDYQTHNEKFAQQAACFQDMPIILKSDVAPELFENRREIADSFGPNIVHFHRPIDRCSDLASPSPGPTTSFH